jgi:hypothetical protein
MNPEQFVWWMKGFLESNSDVNIERIKEQLAKVHPPTDPFHFISTTGTSKASNTFEVPYIGSHPTGKMVEIPPYPYPASPFTFSTLDGK